MPGFETEVRDAKDISEFLTQRITQNPGICGGKACIAGHRIRFLDSVIIRSHIDEIRDEIRSETGYVDKFIHQPPSALEAKLKQSSNPRG